MKIEHFELLDLGVAPQESPFTSFGPSFNNFSNVTVGTGETPNLAFLDMLAQINDLGFDINDTEEIRKDGEEMGFYSDESKVDSKDLVEPDDDMLNGVPVQYYVAIRFDDPNIQDEGEESDGDDTDPDSGDDDDGGQFRGMPAASVSVGGRSKVLDI